MYLKKYKNKYKMLSIWWKFCLNQEATNRGLFCMSMRDRWLVKEHATSDSDRAA